jgi:hypothetical protein
MLTTPHFVSLNGARDEPDFLSIVAGQTVLHAPSGAFLRQERDGEFALNPSAVSKVELAHDATVASYRVSGQGGGIVHQVSFAGGGEFCATFDRDGDLTMLRGSQLRISSRADGLLIVGPMRV